MPDCTILYFYEYTPSENTEKILPILRERLKNKPPNPKPPPEKHPIPDLEEKKKAFLDAVRAYAPTNTISAVVRQYEDYLAAVFTYPKHPLILDPLKPLMAISDMVYLLPHPDRLELTLFLDTHISL